MYTFLFEEMVYDLKS